MREAMLYHGFDHGAVQCQLCPHGCAIAPGRRGICGVRRNDGGRLIALTYGRAAAVNVDPIEKKPLFHFLPGTLSLSVGAVGCNLRCRGCQNWELSRAADDLEPEELQAAELSPQALVEHCARKGYASLSFTYNEPTVFLEYALDTARLARERGIRTVFVTNGYMSEMALREAAGLVDAMNIDLKSFRDEFYRDYCGARLEPVLRTIERAHGCGIWVEVASLVIPGLNDGAAELADSARFLHGLSPELPWHVTAFHPDYHMLDRPHTPAQTLHQAWEIGRQAGLKHVYVGNVIDVEHSATYCPQCGVMLISRRGHSTLQQGLAGGACSACGARVAGVWA